MKSILRPSEGRLLRCFTHMIGLMLSSVALLGYSVLCHLACMAHHVLAKVFCLLVLFPSSLLLDCISWCILIALRSVWFRFVVVMVSASHAAACACCLAVCSCALDVSTPTYSRACSALGSPSLFTWSVMHTLCSHLLDKLPLWSFYLCFQKRKEGEKKGRGNLRILPNLCICSWEPHLCGSEGPSDLSEGVYSLRLARR